MKIDIHCKGMSLTDAIRTHVEDKLAKLERLVPGQLEALTVLHYDASIQGGHFSSEISLRVWGHDLVAKSEGSELYKALAETTDAMLKQVRRLKEKREKSRKGGASIRGMQDPNAVVVTAADDDDDEFVSEEA